MTAAVALNLIAVEIHAFVVVQHALAEANVSVFVDGLVAGFELDVVARKRRKESKNNH